MRSDLHACRRSHGAVRDIAGGCGDSSSLVIGDRSGLVAAVVAYMEREAVLGGEIDVFCAHR